jgi:hypothetical protein
VAAVGEVLESVICERGAGAVVHQALDAAARAGAEGELAMQVESVQAQLASSLACRPAETAARF